MADFRSDTVTQATPRMLEAMASATVGDDVLGDDPTVKALEQRVAAMFGHDAALFMPSGTMSNQCAVAAHVVHGEEVICEASAHVFLYEGGGMARVAGAHVRAIPGDHGMIPVDAIRAAIRPPDLHMPRTALVMLEQSHLFSGGSILPQHYLKAVRELTQEHGLPLHLDGARLVNAQAETGIPYEEYGALFDSISISLNKGLSCPIGSMLIGGGAFIERAKRVRKWLGGGMRQAGHMAACGLVALDEVLPLIPEDNGRCRHLGLSILGLPGLVIDQRTVDTNILFVRVTDPDLDAPAVEASLRDHGVMALTMGERRLRFVTHRGISDADVDRATRALQAIVQDR
ncbi:MAG: hypothetical protein DWQ01_03015 [Planctomycetota bacterium]|nr:MAG: hypothetical protein DWQ01_03015 [Planctomycetota bacterium]